MKSDSAVAPAGRGWPRFLHFQGSSEVCDDRRSAMTNGKIVLITAGVAGAIVLGVWAGPSLMHRDATTTTEPEAVVTPAPAEAEKPGDVRAPRARVATKEMKEAKIAKVAKENRTIAPDKVPALPATEPELHARLKPVLNPGTRMADAAYGFRDAEQFAT